MGDPHHKGEWATGGPGSWEQPSLVCLPWANYPEPPSEHPSHILPGARFSTGQLLAPAHKEHGGRGVAGRLGGEGGSRDRRSGQFSRELRFPAYIRRS